MTRLLSIVIFGLAMLCVASSLTGAQQAPPGPRPGYPTLAQVQILNKLPADAVAVKVYNTGDPVAATLVGVPTVALTTGTAIDARHAVQRWEYSRVLAPNAGDPTDLLNRAGQDGWEVVGSWPADSGRTGWVLKRPRQDTAAR